MNKKIRRGQIWWYKPKYTPTGHIQKGDRPVIIVSNQTANEVSPVVLGVPCTAQLKRNFPTHVTFIMNGHVSTAMADQVIPVDVNDLDNCVYNLEEYIMDRVDLALKYAFGFEPIPGTKIRKSDSFPVDMKISEGIMQALEKGETFLGGDEASGPDMGVNLYSVRRADNIFVSSEEQVPAGRNNWTDKKIGFFCEDHEKMDLDALCQKYNISRSTAEMYYRKFTRGADKDGTGKGENAGR